VYAQPEDETLLTSVGGRERFDALFHQHVAGIASYCRWRSPSFADAEDAVAEVFLIEWEGLTPTEAAAVLHRPPVAARVRLHRARRRFRAAYEAQTVAERPHVSISRSSAGASRDRGAHAREPTRLPKEHIHA
jgi:DNA-directed RNA polymerase specialized sigma24 family protein